MHMLAHLALRSATVEAALQDVCRHAGVTSVADVLDFENEGSIAHFSYASRAPCDDNPWMAEHYLAMAVHFIGQATGRTLPLQCVQFKGPAQAPLAAYQKRFGVIPEFNAARNAICFDAQALAWPLLTHDAYLHDILERVACEHASRANARALRNRLTQRGSGFRSLLDDVRCDLAREHLARGLSVSETAYLLRFSEAAALQHACRRWFGQSAGELRDALRRA